MDWGCFEIKYGHPYIHAAGLPEVKYGETVERSVSTGSQQTLCVLSWTKKKKKSANNVQEQISQSARQL